MVLLALRWTACGVYFCDTGGVGAAESARRKFWSAVCESGAPRCRKPSRSRRVAPCALPITQRSSMSKRAMVVWCQIGFKRQPAPYAPAFCQKVDCLSSPSVLRPASAYLLIWTSEAAHSRSAALTSSHRLPTYPRLDPRQSIASGPRCFQSTRATINTGALPARFSPVAAKR
jgi:hypothetical protein